MEIGDGVGFLEELVSIPSPSGEEDGVAEYLVGRMIALGFDAQRDGAGNVVGQIGNPEAGREIVLLGHMDTVPGQIPVRRSGGRLYGRGAVDAKGPLAAFVLAAARAAPRLNGTRVRVIGAVEEESHARGAHHLARTMEPPYCTIIGEPSGWDGVTLGYRGALTVDYRIVQPGGHSAGELPGPAEQAVSFWNQLNAYAEDRNRDTPGNFNRLGPALRKFRTFGDGLEEGAEMTIVVRLPPGADVADLREQMQTWSDGARLSFPATDPLFRAGKNTAPVRALLRAIRA